MEKDTVSVRREPVYAQPSEFSKVLTKRVREYFATAGTKHANLSMVIKTTIILFGALASWFVLNFVAISGPVSLLVWMSLGAFTAFIGLNICHDLIHGAYFKNPRLNKIFGVLFNIVGADDKEWEQSHNRDHHMNTNIHEFDHDLGGASLSVIRLSPHQQYHKIYRYQHIYVWFPLYMLGTFTWVFFKDYIRFFNRAKSMKTKKEKITGLARLLFFKAIHYTLYLVIPMVCVDLPLGWKIGGFLLMHATESLILVTTFMLAHVVEGNEFPLPSNGDMRMKTDIYTHQLLTTMNFATRNKLVTWFCGGLNYQIEHHLFHKVCHIHYPKLAVIVKETCKEYGISYKEEPTFFGALGLHQQFLKTRGAGN